MQKAERAERAEDSPTAPAGNDLHQIATASPRAGKPLPQEDSKPRRATACHPACRYQIKQAYKINLPPNLHPCRIYAAPALVVIKVNKITRYGFNKQGNTKNARDNSRDGQNII